MVKQIVINKTFLGSNPSILKKNMLTISITFILILTWTLFFIGLLGIVLNRKNIILTLMSIEILLLAVNLNFAILSVYLDDIIGQIFVFFMLTIAAAESALCLALITILYRLKNSIQLKPVKTKITTKI